MPDEAPLRLVVMGVAGAGKSVVGRAVAERFGAQFVEGDDEHPVENRDKMAAGQPLNDDDRGPWLDRLVDRLSGGESVVVSCSALKRVYRDRLRSAGDVRFVHLDLPADVASQRVARRPGHFMPASLVESQFASLEAPAGDELDVVSIAATLPIAEVIDLAVRFAAPGE